MVGLALVASAWAQEAPCGGSLAVSEWRQALDAVESSLNAMDVDRADRILDDVMDSLRCLDEPADAATFGRMARSLAVTAFYDSDSAELASWTWLERDVVGGAWPEAFIVPRRFHELRDALVEPETVSFAAWSPPKKGVMWVDGRPALLAESRSEVQHFVQALDKHGEVAWGGWMLGADAPEAWTETGGMAPELPNWVLVPVEPEPWGASVASADPPDADPPDVDPPDADPAGDGPGVEAGLGNGAPQSVSGSPGERRPRRTSAFQEIFPECPWRAAPAWAVVEGRDVRINRRVYPTSSVEEVKAAQEVFRNCGEFRAARRLSRWVEARKGMLSSGKAEREFLIEALMGDEPKRRK